MAVEGIEDFCRRVSPQLVGALVLQCGQQPLAEDLAQEALARAWERWDSVSTMENPEGWVFRVAFNLVLSQRRRARAEQRAHDRLASNAAHASDMTDVLFLRQALAALPNRQRAAIVLRFYGQLSVREAARVMNCAEGTVKALTSQALARLRHAIHVEDVDIAEVTDG